MAPTTSSTAQRPLNVTLYIVHPSSTRTNHNPAQKEERDERAELFLFKWQFQFYCSLIAHKTAQSMDVCLPFTHCTACPCVASVPIENESFQVLTESARLPDCILSHKPLPEKHKLYTFVSIYFYDLLYSICTLLILSSLILFDKLNLCVYSTSGANRSID